MSRVAQINVQMVLSNTPAMPVTRPATAIPAACFRARMPKTTAGTPNITPATGTSKNTIELTPHTSAMIAPVDWGGCGGAGARAYDGGYDAVGATGAAKAGAD